MTKRTRLLVANWKMNGDAELVSTMTDSLSAVLGNDAISSQVDVVLCAPNTLLGRFTEHRDFSLGGQNVSQYEKGAYTGETSASQLEAVACEYALVGHSERRHVFGETDALIANKFATAAASNLIPVLCIGESLEEREQGETEQALQRQLNAVIKVTDEKHWEKAVIGYEPVWAIGTGKTATPEIAQSAHKFIRDYLATQSQTASIASSVKVLYGGSMKPENAAKLMDQPDIDGGLIGGASLSPDSFVAIINAAANF